MLRDDVLKLVDPLVKDLFDLPSLTIEDQRIIWPDSLLSKTISKYAVNYEKYIDEAGTEIYIPVITIPKGTLLFTGRDSYSRIYVEHNVDINTEYGSNLNMFSTFDDATDLNKYMENIDTKRKYFFPIPFMVDHVKSSYNQMEILVLQKDARLLCLISPSPVCRGILIHAKESVKNKDGVSVFNNGDFNQCGTDLCISYRLMRTLKLSGYIGIAQTDTISAIGNNSKVRNEFAGDRIKLEDTLLFKSSTFTNFPQQNGADTQLLDPERVKYDEAGWPDMSELTLTEIMQVNRVYGIPEIVLYPIDPFVEINEESQKQYQNIFQLFRTPDVWPTQPNIVIPEGKYPRPRARDRRVFGAVEYGVRQFMTIPLNKAFDDARKWLMENTPIKPMFHIKLEQILSKHGLGVHADEVLMELKDNIAYNLQSYPLLHVWTDDCELPETMILRQNDDLSGQRVNFLDTYQQPSSGSHSAFETMCFYEQLTKFIEDTKTGQHGGRNYEGRNYEGRHEVNVSSRRHNRMHRVHEYVKQNANLVAKKPNHVAEAFRKYLKRIVITTRPIDTVVSTPNLYYSERSGIPVFYYKTKQASKTRRRTKDRWYSTNPGAKDRWSSTTQQKSHSRRLRSSRRNKTI